MGCQLRKTERPEHRAVEHLNERGSQEEDDSAEKGAKVQITGSRLIATIQTEGQSINNRIQVQKCAHLMEFPNDHKLKNVTSKY
jgi:hypothetical protein